MAFSRTKKDKETNLVFDTLKIDLKELNERVSACNILSSVKKTLFSDSNANLVQFEYVYANLLLSKVFLDTKQKGTFKRHAEVSEDIFDIPSEIRNDFPNIFPLDSAAISAGQIFEKIRKDINKIDLSIFQNKKTENKDESVLVDYGAEYFLYNTIFQLNGIEDAFLDVLDINDTDIIYVDHNLLYLLRFLLKEKIRIRKLYINRAMLNEFKFFLCYCRLNNIPFEKNILPEPEIIDFTNSPATGNITLFFVKDEIQFNNILNFADNEIRGIIRNLKNLIPDNDFRENITSNFEYISIFQYPGIENSLFKEYSGLLLQKRRKAPNRVINILSNYLQKISESKAGNEQRLFLNSSIESSIINPQKADRINKDSFMNVNFYPAIENIKFIYNYFYSSSFYYPADIENIKSILRSFLSGDTDTPLFKEKINEPGIPVFNASFQEYINKKSIVEFSTHPVTLLNKYKILSSYFYRKDFLQFRERPHPESSFFNRISEIYSGCNAEGILNYHDELIIKESKFDPVISGECISEGNYIDIARVKFLPKDEIKEEEPVILQENDLVFTFSRENEISRINYAILPMALNKSILGKDAFAIRLKSGKYTASSISEYLNYLSEEGIIKQLTFLLNP
jgi:hypothetical protein